MWNKSWDLNVTGSQVMTTIFMPLLLQTPNPRLIFMTSGTSSIANSENMTFAVNHYSPKGWPKGNFDGKSFNVPAYRSAKTGLNMLMREWHRALHEDGVKVWAISPGFLATGLGGAGAEALKKMGAQDPSVAGGFIRGVIEGSRDADVGKVVTANGTQAW
jgi:NAD(P)-dependent dehydrogenase (short-subunit alcohol dehydrogenase family)